MLKFKYIIVNNGTGIEVPDIFSKLVQHDTQANGRKVYAAGFVTIRPGRISGETMIVCHGESVSLKVKSRGQVDADLIKADGEWEI